MAPCVSRLRQGNPARKNVAITLAALLSDLKATREPALPRSPIDFGLIVPPFGPQGKHETSQLARAHSQHCQTGIAGERPRRTVLIANDRHECMNDGNPGAVRGMAGLPIVRVPFRRGPLKLYR